MKIFVTPVSTIDQKRQIFRSCRFQRWSQLRTVSQLTIHQSAPQIDQLTFSSQSRMMVDQYGPSVKLQSLNQLRRLTIQLPVLSRERWSPVWTVNQHMIHQPTTSIDQLTFNSQSRMMVDQYGSSINLQSINRLCRLTNLLSVLSRERRSTSTDRQSTYGPSVDSVNLPANLQLSVTNDS